MAKPKTFEQIQAEAAKKGNAAQRRTGETVTVALNHPAGIIMRVFEMVKDYEPVLGGGQREIQKAEMRGEPIRLNGNAVGKGFIPSWRVVAGFALTPGVPKEFWDLWCEQNKDLPLLKNHLICAYPSIDGATAMAEERAGLRSGLEPIVPDNDPRIPKNNGRRIETGDEQKRTVADLSDRMREVEERMAQNVAA